VRARNRAGDGRIEGARRESRQVLRGDVNAVTDEQIRGTNPLIFFTSVENALESHFPIEPSASIRRLIRRIKFVGSWLSRVEEVSGEIKIFTSVNSADRLRESS